MNFEQREALIHENFIRKMTTMYLPPNNVKQSDASKKLYGEELRKAINQRLSSDIPNAELFNDLLGKVWDKCVAAHDFRIWFTPHLVAKHTAKVNAEWQQRQSKANKLFEIAGQAAEERPRPNKLDPAGQGWTIEKCDAAIEYTRQELGYTASADSFCRIVEKAKERLLNARD
tara:strand:+ start:10482 stop:11000 length:519 start_codon:yes stop_codon:yes gene_type:complete